MNITRRKFVKLASMAGIVGLTGTLTGCGEKSASVEKSASAKTVTAETPAVATSEKSKVYFTKNIDAEHLIELYQKINAEITGKVAIKLHTGEPHGPNILPRDMVQKFQAQVPNSTIIEANVAYGGARSTTERHRETLQTNGWTFSPIDIIDADGDVNFPVNGGLHLKEVAMGAHLADYDSLVVLTHFKGHAMGGFGGSLKNIAIGCASGKVGKLQVHGVKDYGKWVTGELLMELMADSGKAICDHFGKKIVFMNVMRRMSVDCDCAGTSAAEPTCADIGILASTDILAIDQASIDLVYAAPDTKDLRERIESRQGLRQLTAMAELNMGNKNYELIQVG
ncbi:MAG: DUF362 domain-containing protein [Selenomonadaceae bacterium]|nr:DUF362 domain-containing protein [Selenomonadaceae bacterium]